MTGAEQLEEVRHSPLGSRVPTDQCMRDQPAAALHDLANAS